MSEATPRGLVRVEAAPKRVRINFGGEMIADTIGAIYVWEGPKYPAYYIPQSDVRMELLSRTSTTSRSPSRGGAVHFTVKSGGREAVDAAWQFVDSPIEELRDLIRFDWAAMDHWFEEDEEVFTHPRDPYTRVDILASSRHVRVEIDGVTVAETHAPHILFETHLPPRYYMPLTDLRLDLLRPSDSSTHCPYKGQASYWSLEVNGELRPDAVWTYTSPFPESQRIAGLACFFNEKVDLYVDSVLQSRPRTPFS